MKVMILANRDPTSSTIFRAVCDDPRLEVSCIAFTKTLTKSHGFWQGVYDIFHSSGMPYFAYISFWNSVFLTKEWLISHLPLLKRLFRDFFSLKLWAQEQGVEIVYSSDYNSTEFLDVVSRLQPAVLLTRINQILDSSILNSAPYGCWCLHSSELPKYQGIAAEFHSLLNGEKTVGFTVMQMERSLDTGPLIAQGNTSIPENVTLHGLIDRNNIFAQGVIRRAVDRLIADQIRCQPQDLSQKSYYSWPTPEQTNRFRQKGLNYISFCEAVIHIFH